MKNIFLLFILLSFQFSITAQQYFTSDFEGTWALDDVLVHLGKKNTVTFQWENGKTIKGKWNYWGTNESGDKLNIYTEQIELKLIIKSKSLTKMNLISAKDKASYTFTKTMRKIGANTKKTTYTAHSNSSNQNNKLKAKSNTKKYTYTKKSKLSSSRLGDALMIAGSNFLLNALLGGNNNSNSTKRSYHSDAKTNQYMREQHIQEARERGY